MHTFKTAFIAAFAVLASSLLITSCERGNVNARTGAPDLTVTTEDGKGDDMNVTTAVYTALLEERQLKHLDIQVETRKGDVMLSGVVDSRQQSELAEKVAGRTSGVHAVNNKLTIK